MTKTRLSTLFILTALLALAVRPVLASDPVGCYAIIEKVVLEPNDAKATAVQIWGAFALSTAPGSGNTYQPPQKGYLYYTCPAGKDATCLAEWSDLKKLAGKGEIVGFGDRYGKTTTRVRPAAEKVASPDVYPINIGLVKMGHYAGVTYRTSRRPSGTHSGASDRARSWSSDYPLPDRTGVAAPLAVGRPADRRSRSATPRCC